MHIFKATIAQLACLLTIMLAVACTPKLNGPAPDPGKAETAIISEPAAPEEPVAQAEAEVEAPEEAEAYLDEDDSEEMLLEPRRGKGRTPDVHFVPTPLPVVRKMLDTAKVTKKDLVYDLGCGDGRIVIKAAKRYGARAIGFDIDPVRVAEAKANVKKAGVDHLVTIKEADIFELDLTPASVITLYLLPSLNVRLIPQLNKLKPGTRIVSHDFDMEGIQHDKFHEVLVTDDDDDLPRDHHVYFWTTPLKPVEGYDEDYDEE